MRIAVITAPNQGYLNPGMLSVDLAAAGVLKRIMPNSVVSWYTLHPPDAFGPIHRYLNPAELPFRWRPLIEDFETVCSHDAIFLWGDFLQARHYIMEDAVDRLVLSSEGKVSASQALDTLYRCLLFSHASPDVLSKTFIFGSSILFNQQTDYSADHRYGEYLCRLLRHCGGVWSREPISATKVQHLRQDYTSTFLGTDPAFFLRNGDLACLRTTSWLEAAPFNNRIALFFGTRTKPPRALATFLHAVGQRLTLELEWLPWFPLHEWLRIPEDRGWLGQVVTAYLANRRRKIERLMTRGGDCTAGDLLAAVGRYRLIVTDTYHLCVNAWRAGTPAICFGSSDVAPKHQTLNDYKKRVLHEMYDAGDFYFSTSSIESAASRGRAVDKVMTLISDESIAMAITQRMRAHAHALEHTVAERLWALGAP